MHFSIVTLFPEMFLAMDYGVIGRAQQEGIINLRCWNPRDYTENNYRKVDDSPYGGGPGMVMLVKPLCAAILAARENLGVRAPIVYFTPQGRLLTHDMLTEFMECPNLILVAGRYEGIDERLMSIEPGIEISIGDYVVSGGELPAMVFIDTLTRQFAGTVGDVASVKDDSFYHGLLDYPHYTRPEEIYGHKVPEVLLGGDHAAIARFRRKQVLGRTWLRRRSLLEKIALTDEDRMLLNEFIENR